MCVCVSVRLCAHVCAHVCVCVYMCVCTCGRVQTCFACESEEV